MKPFRVASDAEVEARTSAVRER